MDEAIEAASVDRLRLIRLEHLMQRSQRNASNYILIDGFRLSGLSWFSFDADFSCPLPFPPSACGRTICVL
jgi:hypothetical protein